MATFEPTNVPKHPYIPVIPSTGQQPHTDPLMEAGQAAENSVKPQGRWNERAYNFLAELDAKLEENMPPNKMQKVLDDFYTHSIEPLLQKGQELNKLIDENEDYKHWFKNLTVFIAKLPIRAVRTL